MRSDPLSGHAMLAAASGLAAGSRSLTQVSDSTGPLNMWPSGQRILALSSGPSVDVIVYRSATSAGSPHRAVPCRSRYAGQSRNIVSAFMNGPPFQADPHGGASPPDYQSAGRRR